MAGVRGRQPQDPSTDGPQPSQDALDAAFRAHLPAVYRYLYARLHNAADTEDLCGEVFVRAVRWLEAERSPGEVRAWLLRAAATALTEHWRDHYRRAATLQASIEAYRPDAATPPDSDRASRQLSGVLARLPSRYREVLVLRFLEGLSAKEIAERLHLRPDHVRVLQYRALRAAGRPGGGAGGASTHG